MEDSLPIQLSMNERKNEAIKDSFQKDRKRLFDFIRKRVPDKEEAEDILQDVFYQLTQNFSPLEPIEQISAWLFRVAKNKIIDRYRKHKTESLEKHVSGMEGEVSLNLSDFLIDPNEGPEAEYAKSIIWKALGEALDDLPAEQRDVFVMHELEGKDFKEISKLTGEQVNTLISRKRYAVLYLRERLQYLYNEYLNF
jgi:RNA polymerase sigma factor (sigma-70 family)